MGDYLRSTDSETFKRPIIGLLVVVAVVFGVLILRLFYLQIMQGQEYHRLSKNNSIRRQAIDPQRGLIYDRHGGLLVDNRPAFDLQITLEDAQPLEPTLARLGNQINIPLAQLRSEVRKSRQRPAYEPITLLPDIDRNLLAVFEVHQYDLPGLGVRVSPKRYYIHHASAAHVLGYLGQINAREMKSNRYADVESGDFIGKFGVERAHQTTLQGQRGGRQVEVTATGQVVRELSRKPAQPGRNLELTIDMALQQQAEHLLGDNAGAVVVVDVETGEVLVMASSPAFDPNDFINGMSHKKWQTLITNPYKPLQNKALQAEYPPASTYKIVTAMAGLAENVITPQTTFECKGGYYFGDRMFRCWKRGGHGTVDLQRAIAESCDVYFYKVGERLGVDRLARYAKAAGLGHPTGIALEHEAGGLIPTADWKKRRFGRPWMEGETLSISIGQGYNLVTPLQMAMLTAAVANDGRLLKPHIVRALIGENSRDREVLANPQIINRLPVSQNVLQEIRKGLLQVVTHPKGTAHQIKLETIAIAGKTGTAQVIGRKKGDASKKETKARREHQDHAWFVAYAPAQKPRIALAVIVEHGEHGSSAAAPIAQKLIEAYLGPPPKAPPATAQTEPRKAPGT